MCGIVGYVGQRPASDIVVDALRRMEYRGYDSSGIALLDGHGGLAVRRRAGRLARGRLTVVKVAKPNQDMRFDVPVIGVTTIETMQKTGATCLALDAGKCLLLDGDAIITAADQANISIVAQ